MIYEVAEECSQEVGEATRRLEVMKSWDSNCKVELTQLKMEKVSNINSNILNLSSENNHKCRNSKRKVLGSSSDKVALDGDEKNPNYFVEILYLPVS